jgi:non-specific riboncleoside hydrolase
MKTIPLIIDTDPGIDDTIALSIALNAVEFDIKLISTVAGNMDIDTVTTNALQIVNFFDAKIKVAKGAANPLVGEHICGSFFHGKTGMDGFPFTTLKEDLLSKDDAVTAISKVLETTKEKVTIVTLGPLTNIANLITNHPNQLNKIEQIIIMGGALGRGNCRPLGEHNMVGDPEAAKIVLESKLPLVFALMDAGVGATLTPLNIKRIKHINKTGKMFSSLLCNYRSGNQKAGPCIYDLMTIAYLLEPAMFTIKDAFMSVEVTSKYLRGTTTIDIDGVFNEEKNVKVLTTTDTKKFERWLFKRIRRCLSKF